MRLPPLLQLFCFGAIGTGAALTHLLVVMLLVERGGLPPLLANGGGFLVAFAVSYLGHRHLTFADTRATPVARSLPRFFAVACLGFLLNEALFALLLVHTPLAYPQALLLVLAAVALVTFVLSRSWAFG